MFNRDEYLQKTNALIPYGSSTNSKAPFAANSFEPAAITHGKGCRVWDIEGREYIDFRNALGPVTLGYAYDEVNEAISAQLAKGVTYGHPCVLEGELAEILHEVIPCGEMVRFLKTGGEAIAACIRIARGYTGRDNIIQIGYNGWLNSLAAGGPVLPGQLGTSPKNGVPKAISDLHHSAGWADMDGIKAIVDRLNGNVAAVIVAADYADMEKGREFYPALREYTAQKGILLIYDEIVTGFRVALGGVQEYFGVTPDMAVFSKGMANGMPLSVYAGKSEFMKCCGPGGGVVVSSTFGGEALSIAASIKTIEIYRRDNVINHFWEMGKYLWDNANQMFEKYKLPIKVVGNYPCPSFTGDMVGAFISKAYEFGVSLYGVSYINFSHKKADVDMVLEAFEKTCGAL